MLQLGCNACQILPWVIRSKKFIYIKFIQCFVLEINVKITKGHWSFVKGSNFKVGSIFNENGLKLIGSSSWFRKGIVLHIQGVRKLWIKGSKVNAHICLYRPYGLWPLNFDPSFDQIRDIKVYETIHFLNLQDNPINLSPFSLKLDQLENLTPVQKVNDLLLFWPLSGERNVV